MDVSRWIDRWTSEGLLDEATAGRLREDVVAAAVPDGSGEVLAGARGMVLEAVGYLGAALVLGALGILFDVTQWPQVLVVVLLFATSAVGSWGVWRLTPPASDAAGRLASVSGATAVATLAAGLALALDPDCATYGTENRCGWVQDNLYAFVVAVAAASLAVVVHRRHATAITHFVLGVASVGLTWATVHLPFGPRLDEGVYWREEEVTFGAALIVVALVWVWAAETGRLRPAWIGTFGAAGAFFIGLVMVTGYDPFFGTSDHTPILAALGAGAGFLWLGVSGDRLRLTIVGVVALLFTIPATLTEVLGLDGATVTFVMLPVGLALLGWAVREGRSDARAALEDADAGS